MMRVVISKKDLLFPLWLYPLHVVLLGVSAIVGGGLVFWKRRVMVVSLQSRLKKDGLADPSADPGDVPHIDIFSRTCD